MFFTCIKCKRDRKGDLEETCSCGEKFMEGDKGKNNVLFNFPNASRLMEAMRHVNYTQLS